MEVQLSPEQEAQLAALAAQEGCTPDELARDVFSRALADEARFVEAVKQGLRSLDRGEYISHQEVGARIERLFQP
jgi:predicted transcriptional regulator